MELEYNFNNLLDDDFFNSVKSRKDKVIQYVKKHFIEDRDYKIILPNANIKVNGGQNKKDYYLSDEAIELLKNSYKLRQIDLGKKNITHPILISIETATISFIYDVYYKDNNIRKQYNVKNKYFIDLYFIDKKIAIECDEDFHKHTKIYDNDRENFIKKELNCTFYRYNPSEKKLSNIIYELNKLLFTN